MSNKKGTNPSAPHRAMGARSPPQPWAPPPVPVWVLGFARGPEVPDAVTCSRGGPWEQQPGLRRNLGLLK